MNKQLKIDPEDIIKQKIFIIRGQRVILDSDLAELYDVTTKEFNRIVKRNTLRFPADFMFQLLEEEFKSLRYQIGTSKVGRGGRRYLPYAFVFFYYKILNLPSFSSIKP